MTGIREVADRAGVSTATVSHVINGTRAVSDDTRARVVEAIQNLGYRPNAIARSLTTRRTKTIGVVISNVANVFFAEIILGIESVLGPLGYQLILCNTEARPEKEQRQLEILLNQRVDGIIAAAASEHWPQLESVGGLGVPVVFVDRVFPGISGPTVTVDNQDGAYVGVAHLIQDGYRSIGILAGRERMSTMTARLNGYRTALESAGLPLDDRLVITSDLSIEDGRRGALTLLAGEARPEALFCSNNLLGLGALEALRQLGLRCPADVGLLMFDDHPWAKFTDPPLSVVRQPTHDIGRLAAQRLLASMDDDARPQRDHLDGSAANTVTLRTTLVIRSSCRLHDSSTQSSRT